MAFLEDPKIFLKYLQSVGYLAWDYLEEVVDDFEDMKLYTTLTRWYRFNRASFQLAAVVGLFLSLFVWFFTKGYFVSIARRARQGWEVTIATKVERIASQFEDALTVSYRKATWELVKENVGVYALQGRRGSMEDRFTFVNQLEHSCISLYGVFDGHGGEVSCCLYRTTSYI